MSDISLGEAVVDVGADASGFRRDVQRQVGAGMDAATRQAAQSVGNISKLARRAAIVGFGALTYGAARFVKSSVDAERAFSATMRTLQASTGATTADIDRLNDTAIKLGQATSFSAQEAADGMLTLGKAGLKTEEILAAVPEVMNLAATEGLALDNAAGIVTASLAQFNLNAGQSAVVVNALAGASNASRSSVAGLGESLKLVGSAASGIGLSVQETAGALAALSESGLEGSIAGTSLASVFNRLTPTTTKASDAMSALNLDFTDAKGNFDSIDVIAGKLQTTFKDMDAESRKIALGEIFGKDASVIAAVNALIRQGKTGLQDFTKAAEDSNAAQKLAQARLSGTEGALEQLSGSIETAKLRLGQELAPAIEAGANALSKNLVPAMEAVIDGAKAIGEAVGPLVSEIATTFSGLVGSGDAAGSMFYDVFIPAVKATSDVLAALLGIFNSLPGPVKSSVGQLAIFAFAFSKLSGPVNGAMAVIKQFGAEMTYGVTRTQRLEAGMARLAGAAKLAAGAGGLLLLSHAASETNDNLQLLEAMAGGALIGGTFGPLGAVVGAAAGALATLALNTGDAKDAMAAAKELAKQYAATLSQVSGAAKLATYESVALNLQQEGAFELGQKLGISTRDLVNATLGHEDALTRVNAATELTGESQAELHRRLTENGTRWEESGKAQYAAAAAADELRKILGLQSGAVQKSQADVQALAIASGKLTRALGDVQGKGRIVNRLEMAGDWPTGLRDVINLTKGLHLTPKELRIVAKTLGIDVSLKQVTGLQQKMKETSKVPVDPSTFVQSVKNMMSVGGGIVDKGGGKVKKGLKDAGHQKIDDTWLKSLTNGLTTGKGRASTGGREIGNNLKQGVLSGIGGLEALLSGQVTAAVNGAIAAGRAAADAHSPSRKMWQLGLDLIGGLKGGIEEGGPKALKAMLDQLTKLQDKTKEKLGALRDEFTSLADSIASAFTPDLFQAESLKDFFHQGNVAFGNLIGLKKAFKQLKKWGIDPAFLAQLFASGNSDLIMELAEGTKGQAQNAASLFTDIQNLTGRLGRDVARDVLGPKLDKLGHKLDQIRDAIKGLTPKKDKAGGKAASPIPAAASSAAGAPSGASLAEAAVLFELQALRTEVGALTAVTAAGPREFGQTIRGIATDSRVRGVSSR